MEQLSWKFGLDDGVSAPAKKIKTGLESVNSAFRNLGASAKEAGNRMTEGIKKFGEINEKLYFSIELFKKFAEPVVELGEKVFDLGKEFAKAAYESAEFSEKSTIAFKAVLGDGAKASKLMEEIVTTASKLPITTQSAIGYATSFITGGFKPEEISNLLTAVGDIGALNPANTAGAQEELVSHLRRTREEGFLDFRSLRGMAGIGINEGTLSANIGKALKIPLDQVREAIEHRKVGMDVGIKAILDTIASTEGGRLGNLSNQLAETPGGLLTTIKSRFFEAAMDLSEGPGFKALTGMLKNIRDLTDLTTDKGRQLKAAVGETFNSIFTSLFGKFSGASGKSGLEEILDRVTNLFWKLPDVVEAVFGDIGDLLTGFFGKDFSKQWGDIFDAQKIRAMGPAFESIGVSLRKLVDIAGRLAGILLPVFEFFIAHPALAGAIVGTVGGFSAGIPLAAATGGWSIVAGAVAGGLGGAGLGAYLGHSDLPAHGAGGITTGEHVARVGDGGSELIAPLPAGGLASLMGGGGGRSISVGEIHIHLADGEGASQDVKEQVRQGTALALQQILEAMNLEMGAGIA
jgi:hypothetical protein